MSELMQWVNHVMERERKRGTTGEVRIQMHEGVIQRVKIESTEKPPKCAGPRLESKA